MSPPDNYVYLEIAEAVRRLIISGELAAGERLPSVRQMAERWACTPNTVSRAYTTLAQEGLVTAHRGGGTRVASSRPDSAGTAAGWEWARLVNRAENYLLESLAHGHTPSHAEAALAAAISRWQELRSDPDPERVPAKAGEDGPLRFAGSHDLTVELLARMLAERIPPVELSTSFVGSLGGLMALARGEAELAGSHLWDVETGEYNLAYVRRLLPNRSVTMLALVGRVQGLIVPAGNPKSLTSLVDLARPEVSIINRQAGSGTRVWLDVRLRAEGLDPASLKGYENEENTHLGVARAVAENRADAGLGVSAAAAAYGLDFLPLAEERYDLVIPAESWAHPSLAALRQVVVSDRFKEAVRGLGGYDTTHTGTETRID